MLYQHLKIVRRIGKYTLLVVPLLVVLFFLIRATPVSLHISNSTHAFGKPFWTLSDYLLNYGAYFQTLIQSKYQLEEENILLKEAIATLQRETYLLDSLKSDNATLRSLVGNTVDKSGFLSASVIHDMALSAHDIFIIDSGVRDGVREHMLILTPEGLAIGYVSTALETTSIVRRFSAPDTNLDVVVLASTTIHATLSGHGSGTMKLTVPRDVKLETSNLVLLPTFSTLPIGQIASIVVTPEDAYKTAYLRSPVNMHELRYVHIDTTQSWDTTDAAGAINLRIHINEPPVIAEEDISITTDDMTQN